MLCSKCGKEIPKGQEVHRNSTVRDGSTIIQGGTMCKECAFSKAEALGALLGLSFVFIVLLVIIFVRNRPKIQKS